VLHTVIASVALHTPCYAIHRWLRPVPLTLSMQLLHALHAGLRVIMGGEAESVAEGRRRRWWWWGAAGWCIRAPPAALCGAVLEDGTFVL
jgi:hypothetical protein